MTYDGQYLWVVDFAEKKVFKLDPTTGSVVGLFDTPTPSGVDAGCKGITWDGSYLYVMGWAASEIYKMDRNGTLLETIPLDNGGGGGLAWDGEHFWTPGGKGILKYTPQGQMVGWIYAASEGTWDMTWDGQYLWASQRTNENWQDAKIFALEILDDHDRPLYVDGSNPTAGSGSQADPYQTIDQALNAAAAGSEIWVAQGTYVENLIINRDLDLYGGFASYTSPFSWTRDLELYPTTLDGGHSGSVVTFESNSDGAVLDGFTVTNGQADNAGGGITIENGSPAIRSCRIEGNSASDSSMSYWGSGGVLIGGEEAAVVISNTIIANNSAVADTGAAGIRIGDASVTVVNTLLAGNSGQPAIHTNDAVLTLTHVTVADNDPTQDSVFLGNSQTTIRNSIFWEQGPDIVAGGGSLTIDYSNVEDGVVPGTGNMSSNPLFVNAAKDNYRLQGGSPCIDKGTPFGVSTDLEGNARDTTPDLGAYEFTEDRVYLPLIIKDS